MRNWTIILISIALIASCNDKKTFYDAVNVSDSIFVEKFYGYSGGVFGDVLCLYLTDSIRFRKFIISHEDKERVYFKMLDNDKIEFVKRSMRKANYNETLDSLVLSIGALKKEGEFE